MIKKVIFIVKRTLCILTGGHNWKCTKEHFGSGFDVQDRYKIFTCIHCGHQKFEID